jgi:hypothetical protein
MIFFFRPRGRSGRLCPSVSLHVLCSETKKLSRIAFLFLACAFFSCPLFTLFLFKRPRARRRALPSLFNSNVFPFFSFFFLFKGRERGGDSAVVHALFFLRVTLKKKRVFFSPFFALFLFIRPRARKRRRLFPSACFFTCVQRLKSCRARLSRSY